MELQAYPEPSSPWPGHRDSAQQGERPAHRKKINKINQKLKIASFILHDQRQHGHSSCPSLEATSPLQALPLATRFRSHLPSEPKNRAKFPLFG